MKQRKILWFMCIVLLSVCVKKSWFVSSRHVDEEKRVPERVTLCEYETKRSDERGGVTDEDRNKERERERERE